MLVEAAAVLGLTAAMAPAAPLEAPQHVAGKPSASARASRAAARPSCSHVVLEGTVNAGQSYAAPFAPGLRFMLEAIASGWIVRVVPEQAPREAHDMAELATPPFRSVTPLAISTDFSFRAQDAVAWNPRRFRYAADSRTFAEMRSLYDPAMAGDAKAVSRLAALAAQQPEATLTVLDANLSPGTNDQAAMAAAVASHIESTPHTVDTGSASALGRINRLHFRVALALPPGVSHLAGVRTEAGSCQESSLQPTLRQTPASQNLRSPSKKP